MKFPYSSYEVDRSATVPEGIVYRPEVIIRVIGPRGAIVLQSLADTGSDETVLPLALAGAIGVELDHRRATSASGVSGHSIRLIPGRVTLEMSQDQESYRWSAMVGFMELQSLSDETVLLGYSGFFEYFSACFDSELRELTISPNSQLAIAQK